MEGRGLGRAGAEPRKGGQPPGPSWGLGWGSESSAHGVPSHRNFVVPQPSADVELQYAFYGAEAQLLPLGLAKPLVAVAVAALGARPEAVCCKQLCELPWGSPTEGRRNFSGH